ncbi:class I SAM-dependent methyltransferase [Marinihelvus fidelis]|uniref:Class I SAM-dependent methyltransferase n=1 Tax=Marinihelvus fidelis TaxID=2613842 RepID=A0A5N0TDI5_9GAMM|nr:class I SAM-dependent methyltransferase [Marinihelvus fidelis]KAA9131916.1 class I SAM-dependent methyltransferase [Marinihelvus fidelis]
MSPVAQLLARQQARFSELAPMWINPPGDLFDALPGCVGHPVFSQDRVNHDRLARQTSSATFGDFPTRPPAPPRDIVLTLPRGKACLEMMIACCANMLAPSGRLWLAGENRDGIKSAGKSLQTAFRTVNKVDSARHCALFCATDAALTGAFDPAQWRDSWVLERQGATLEIHSWPGVFNHGALDDGTALLLDVLEALDPGPAMRVLDLGCGAGVLGASLLARQPGLKVVLSDTSALACHAARSTLVANGLNAEVVPSDGFAELAGTFDLVVTNPPFHRGHKGDPEMTPRLLAPIRNFLTARGQLIMVANRHLPYTQQLRPWFATVNTLAANRRFQVLHCLAPNRMETSP